MTDCRNRPIPGHLVKSSRRVFGVRWTDGKGSHSAMVVAFSVDEAIAYIRDRFPDAKAGLDQIVLELGGQSVNVAGEKAEPPAA